MQPSPERRHVRARNVATVVLAVVSGATDAVGFLALGGAFTSVMTGNMVLLGISAGRLDGQLAGHTGAAIVCFVLGCAAGTRLAGTARSDGVVWPAAITRALWVEFAALCVFAIGWWAAGSSPDGTVQLVLLVVNALALGIQSSAVLRFGVSGLSTTYLTGTLTTLVARLVSGHRLRDLAHSALILAGLIGGAAASAVLVRHAPVAVPTLQLVGLGIALAIGLAVRAHDHPEVASPPDPVVR
jgi:uncharacterized membrane protein YoaK (UPF0700 family)